MNNQIKELFKRAGGKTSIHNLMSNPVQHREYNELWDENITKFAELIVKECVKFCEHESNNDDHDEYDMGMWAKAQSIKTAIMEHFGVEE
jgi:hypothetical protein